MILYTNSCSYGVCSTGKTYTDFIGEGLNADQVINAGKVGCCNFRIFRTTVRDILELEQSGTSTKDIVALISLTSSYRSEIWLDDEPAQETDGHFYSFQVSSVKENDIFNFAHGDSQRFATEWFRMYNQEAEVTNLLFMINMLVSFFESKGIQYLIWNGPMIYKDVDYSAPFAQPFYNAICDNPRVLDLSNFSFSKYCSIDKNYTPYDASKYGKFGHHGEPAHQDFAACIMDKLNEI